MVQQLIGGIYHNRFNFKCPRLNFRICICNQYIVKYIIHFWYHQTARCGNSDHAHGVVLTLLIGIHQTGPALLTMLKLFIA